MKAVVVRFLQVFIGWPVLASWVIAGVVGQVIFGFWWTAWMYSAMMASVADYGEDLSYFRRFLVMLSAIYGVSTRPVAMVIVAYEMEREFQEDPDLDVGIADAYRGVAGWLKDRAEEKEPGINRKVWEMKRGLLTPEDVGIRMGP